MKALVTGAGGFLGRYIAEQLVQRGDYVRGFSRQSYPELAQLGIEFVRGDIRDAAAVAAACRGVDVVFHVAAVPGVWGPWRRYYETNTLGTKHVIDGCRRHNVGKLVFTSSPSVTFSARHQCNVDESEPYPDRWLCHYPHSKALAEKAVLEANQAGQLLTCALRPHLVWGPRDPHLVPRLLDRARRNRLRQVGDRTNLVDMIYVENAAHAHLLAADALQAGAPVTGRTYFISQGAPVNCWQWINQILELAGLPPVTKGISFHTAWRIGAALETIYRTLQLPGEPPMTRFIAAQLAMSHYFNIQRARSDLGYQPLVSTEEGMRRLGHWLHNTQPR